MTTHDIPDELQDILDAYVAATSEPTTASLAAWIRRYPQYERDLTEFAVNWSLSDTLPTAPEVEAIPAETLVQRGMARVHAVLAAQGAASIAQTAPAITNLATEARARGLSLRAVARESGLSVVLLSMLDRRLIQAASIPREAVEAVAGAIGREAAAVAQYLQGAPTLAHGANYYSQAPPALAEQEDFFKAVREAPDVDEDTRARWLALEQPGT